jgi:hypothetical protein
MKNQECGCYVKTDITCRVREIVYCPLHEAAPQTLEALRGALEQLERCGQGSCSDEREFIREAIAKAEGVLT